MDDLEQIIQIISQVPDLIDAAQTYKETNEKTVRALSSAIKQKPMAEVPQSEIAKLISQISQTKCAMPDAGELTDAIVKNITQIMTPIIQETLMDTIASMKIRLKHEHTHNHYSIGDLWKLVEEKSKKWILSLGLMVFLLLAGLAIGTAYIIESEVYLGQRCWEVYTSKYLTADEKKEMHDELYGLAAYPRKYVDRPRALRERLKENKSILKERQKQAKNNDGKFSVKEKVGF